MSNWEADEEAFWRACAPVEEPERDYDDGPYHEGSWERALSRLVALCAERKNR